MIIFAHHFNRETMCCIRAEVLGGHVHVHLCQCEFAHAGHMHNSPGYNATWVLKELTLKMEQNSDLFSFVWMSPSVSWSHCLRPELSCALCFLHFAVNTSRLLSAFIQSVGQEWVLQRPRIPIILSRCTNSILSHCKTSWLFAVCFGQKNKTTELETVSTARIPGFSTRNCTSFVIRRANGIGVWYEVGEGFQS